MEVTIRYMNPIRCIRGHFDDKTDNPVVDSIENFSDGDKVQESKCHSWESVALFIREMNAGTRFEARVTELDSSDDDCDGQLWEDRCVAYCHDCGEPPCTLMSIKPLSDAMRAAYNTGPYAIGLDADEENPFRDDEWNPHLGDVDTE